MKRQTFEHALHQWPPWHESIESSRKKLGYNVHASPDDRIQWLNDHVPEIREQYQSELKRLELPLPLSLYQYWCSCLYNDYRTEHGEIDYSKITSFVPTESSPSNKALPELPCGQHLVWREGEDIHDPWIRVEIKIHARFATKELFSYAVKHAYKTLENNLFMEQIAPHPITQWLKGGRPKADKSVAVECVHLKDDLGWTYVQIGKNYKWPLQRDSHGKFTQCSTARYYVNWGRELRKISQQ